MNKLINEITETVENNDSTDYSDIITNSHIVDDKQTVEVIITGVNISIRPILENISKLREWCVRDVNLKDEFINHQNIEEPGVVLICYNSKSKHHIFYTKPQISEEKFYQIKEEYGYCLVAFNKETENIIATASTTQDMLRELKSIEYDAENTIVYNTGDEYYN